MYSQSLNNVDEFQGSWGGRLHIRGGERLDEFSRYPGTNAERTELIQMLRNHSPNAAISTNQKKDYHVDKNGSLQYVDTDGLNDPDDSNYKIIQYVSNDPWSDYTCGHITPLAQGAPPNSWAYEEFTIPDIQESPISISSDNSKLVIKHMWAPIRATWTSERSELMFTAEQAYHFVKNITEVTILDQTITFDPFFKGIWRC